MAVITRLASFWAMIVLMVSVLVLAANGVRTSRISRTFSYSSSTSRSSRTLTVGEIVGIVVGVIGGFILVAVVVMLIKWYRRRKAQAASGSATGGQVIKYSNSPDGVPTVSKNQVEPNTCPPPPYTMGDNYASPFVGTTESRKY